MSLKASLYKVKVLDLQRRMTECLRAGDFCGLELLSAQLYVLLRDGQ